MQSQIKIPKNLLKLSPLGVLILLITLFLQDPSQFSPAALSKLFGNSQQTEDSGGSRVTRVIDGDTIQANVQGKVETIRLIGINTPETVDPRKPMECFGKEASAKTKELIQKKTVKIETDPTQDTRDKYGRLLAYVFLDDGTNINKKLIEEGYAYEYTYERPYKFQSEFKTAQHDAEQQKKGLWAPGVCEK